jgi:LysR family transcriptional regulator, benzoate and cis,cis-muconate-responsive activator of ben and cat genes
MELRQLRNFVAVAETGNISAAAKKIFLTQPALSRQIKALEDELGQPLLERSAHSIRLTPAGERLLPEARELLRHADEVRERIRSSERGVRLRVGYAPSLASGIMAAAVADFSRTHPGARVELLDLSSVEMLGGLADNKLDIALLAASGAKSRGFAWHHLLSAEWRLAVSRRHPLARRQRISPADAAREPLLIFNRRDYPGYWNIVSTWLRRHRLSPGVAGEYDGAESLLAAVESGLGVALVTTRSVRHFAGRVHFKTLTQEPDAVSIAAVCRTERSGERPLAMFIESLRQAAKEFA